MISFVEQTFCAFYWLNNEGNSGAPCPDYSEDVWGITIHHTYSTRYCDFTRDFVARIGLLVDLKQISLAYKFHGDNNLGALLARKKREYADEDALKSKVCE